VLCTSLSVISWNDTQQSRQNLKLHINHALEKIHLLQIDEARIEDQGREKRLLENDEDQAGERRKKKDRKDKQNDKQMTGIP
jgi:hypothetical protein